MPMINLSNGEWQIVGAIKLAKKVMSQPIDIRREAQTLLSPNQVEKN